jgi:serine/threonine protein phosphatase 1
MTSPRVFEQMPRRLYAVGDIHGCADELAVMLRYLKEVAGLEGNDTVVFMGDYVDRGPASRAVVDLLLEFQREFPGTLFLRGNHEDMLLGFLGHPGSMGRIFLENGGVETAQSYGLKAPRGVPIAVDQFQQVIPARHLSFFLNLERYLVFPKFIFAHAGLNPERDLLHQVGEDLFWIRDPFINNIHRFERVVVFGHTPYEDVLFHLPYKIGIDTGLVYGNMLTAVELVHGHVFQVKRSGEKVSVSTFSEAR